MEETSKPGWLVSVTRKSILPDSLVPVMIYSTSVSGTDGFPEISPVVVFNVSPAGRAGETEKLNSSPVIGGEIFKLVSPMAE